MSMSGKVVVVAGASRGLGAAAAARFAGEGARTYLLARDKGQLDSLVVRCGNNAVALACDLTSAESVRTAFDAIAAQTERIDVLVYSAGTAYLSDFESVDDDELVATFATNVFGAVYALRSALPLLRAGDGRVITVSSAITTLAPPSPMLWAYAASKAALERFSEAANYELREHGVQVTRLVVGVMQGTTFGMHWDPGVIAAFFDQLNEVGHLKVYAPAKPLETTEVADVMVYIATRDPNIALDVVHVQPHNAADATGFAQSAAAAVASAVSS